MSARPNSLVIYTQHLTGRFRRTGIFWAIGLGLYIALLILSYPSFRESGLLALENYPKTIIEAFGIEDLTTIGPFLDVRVFSSLPLVLSFFPVMTFASALAGAEERGSLDILLGNPIPRRHVVLGNWLALALVLLAVLLVVAIVSWGSGRLIDVGLGAADALRASFNLFPITMAIGTLALALSAWLRSRGAVIGISFAVMFLMYLFETIGRISPTWAGLRWASAFRFYGSAITDGIDWGNAALLLGVSVVLLVLAIGLFDRRDIYT